MSSFSRHASPRACLTASLNVPWTTDEVEEYFCQDKAGKVITYVIDGKLENLGLPTPLHHGNLEESDRERPVQDQPPVGKEHSPQSTLNPQSKDCSSASFAVSAVTVIAYRFSKRSAFLQ